MSVFSPISCTVSPPKTGHSQLSFRVCQKRRLRDGTELSAAFLVLQTPPL